MRGGHHIKSWSSTQKKITLSSGEAELAACIKASSETIGVLQMTKDLGTETEGEVFVDSSAALGIVHRKGNGKLRHIRVGQLWIQQTAEDEVLTYKKINGKENPADLCTKNLTQAAIDKALEKIEMILRSGRAELGLQANAIEMNNGMPKTKKVMWADMQEEEEHERRRND